MFSLQSLIRMYSIQTHHRQYPLPFQDILHSLTFPCPPDYHHLSLSHSPGLCASGAAEAVLGRIRTRSFLFCDNRASYSFHFALFLSLFTSESFLLYEPHDCDDDARVGTIVRLLGAVVCLSRYPYIIVKLVLPHFYEDNRSCIFFIPPMFRSAVKVSETSQRRCDVYYCLPGRMWFPPRVAHRTREPGLRLQTPSCRAFRRGKDTGNVYVACGEVTPMLVLNVGNG